jgi:hypothetical protein
MVGTVNRVTDNDAYFLSSGSASFLCFFRFPHRRWPAKIHPDSIDCVLAVRG